MANVNERFTNWDEYEFSQQNREAAKIKKEIMAKRAAKQGLQEPVKKIKKTALQKQMDANSKKNMQVDESYSIIEELKNHFSPNGKCSIKNKTRLRMQQFLRYTNEEYAKHNIAGGNIFTDANKFGKDKDTWGKVFELVGDIRRAVFNVVYQLTKYDKPDAQQLLHIEYAILELNDALSNSSFILQQPVVRDAIKRKVPFWVGGEEGRGGHNVGMETILMQFVDDYKYGAYKYIAEKLEDIIKQMNDPMSYIAESKKTTIKEGQLKQLIKESIIRLLNESTTDETLMNRWDNLVQALGADEMCNALFQAMSHDEIESMVEILERNYEVGDTYGPNYDEEY